jgi:mannosyl-3-phosphoglycerate phosphatase
MDKKIIVFADLDGTLLDLKTYSFEISKESVEKLKRNGVTVVFCSSKTKDEQKHYQTGLNLNDPIIVENGSAIIFPQEYDEIPDAHDLILGDSSSEIKNKLFEFRNKLNINFKMFSELSVEELSQITGLDKDAAERAQKRDYSETIIPEEFGEKINQLGFSLKQSQLSIKHGGRFFTVTSSKSDKGNAIKKLVELYKKNHSKIITIGIGDSANDLPMLKAVDMPFLVQRTDNSWLDTSLAINRIMGVGPAGFSNMVKSIFKTSLFNL